jgi:hypothetical protein
MFQMCFDVHVVDLQISLMAFWATFSKNWPIFFINFLVALVTSDKRTSLFTYKMNEIVKEVYGTGSGSN